MTKQFILDTLLPYKKNKALISIDPNGRCYYLSDDGRKCAIGKHMKEGEWQNYIGDVSDLFRGYSENNIMSQEWIDQQIPLEVADNMQKYHDSMCDYQTVSDLEELTGYNLSELLNYT
jgi:hypothetical protein